MKKFLPDLIAILAFVLLSFVYFFPADIEGRILFQHDTAAGAGAGQESVSYHQRTGERTRWTNSLFGGMPTYQMSPSYDSGQPLQWEENPYHLILHGYVGLVFIMMLGFYLLLRVFGLPAGLSALGGIVWAFSSYFFILIAAGHIWKFITLAYIPPTIAGLVLVYKKKYLTGGLLTALFLAMQIQSNHVQMSYYFLFVMLFIAGAFFEEAWRKKELPAFFKSSGVLIVAALVGVAVNSSNLYHTYQYSKETMRGKSELKHEGAAAQQASGGLNRNYITGWSYGIGETFSLLVPNVKGGASVPLSKSEKAMEKANPEYAGLYSQLTQYFGDQPMTSGPVYVGAFVLMLFVLGCFVVKGPLKWALLGATVFSITLAWGKNFMGMTDFFIDYVPMYNKFRAVSSILVIAEFTIPLLAMLTLKELLAAPERLREKLKYVYISFGLTGGLAFLFAVAPRLFFSSFIPDQEMAMLQQGLPAEQLPAILNNLEEMRVHLFTADAWRSFFVVAAGTLVLLAYQAKKMKAGWAVGAVALLCLVDLWSVNKRYLNDEQFVPQTIRTESFEKTATDEQILQDTALDYRVLNFASDTFNENNTSYWHKSVGGYHAAKLQRYQDLIDRHIAPQMQAAYQEIATAGGQMDSVDAAKFGVLNLLNAKYFIFPAGKQGETVPVQNPYAYGNAWLVSEVKYVANANEELDALDGTDLQRTAVVDVRFKTQLNGIQTAFKDSLSQVRLTAYEPNRLTYEVTTAKPGLVVFSEIYYPGWVATIDGKPATLARADYVLRAMAVPAGKHTVEMRFDPQSLHITERLSYGAFALILLAFIAAVVGYRKRWKSDK
ncbi:MAG: YfhO family protein [Bacteroides sp.]